MTTHFDSLIDTLTDFIAENYGDAKSLFLPSWPVVSGSTPSLPPQKASIERPTFEKVSKEKPAIKPKKQTPAPAKPITPPAPQKTVRHEPKHTLSTSQQKAPHPPSPNMQMAQLIKSVAPALFLHSKMPDDSKAKKIKQLFIQRSSWPEIPVFYSKQLANYKGFLQNIVKAIDLQFAPSQLIEIDTIEKEDDWEELLKSDSLRMIIAPDVLIFGFPKLITHFQENPATNAQHLHKTPLFLLPDLSLYLKDPELKRSLWLDLKKRCIPFAIQESVLGNAKAF